MSVSRSFFLQASVVILLLAAGVRFYRLDVQSFWNDEGNSARLSERSPALIVEGTASDVHPPLYYLLLRGWRELAGASEFGLRALSAFAGVLTVAAVIPLGALWGRPAALLAGLGTALSPPLVYYSQEARMYSLLALFAVLTSLLVWRWLRAERRRKGALLPLLLAYALLAAAGWWTHYSFPAVIAAQGLLVGLWLLKTWRARGWGRVKEAGIGWGLAFLAVLILYLPWLPVFLRSSGRAAAAGGSAVQFLATAGRWLNSASVADQPLWLSGALWLLAAAGLGLGWRRPGYRLATIGLALWLIVPILLMQAVGATTANYLKFLTAAVPPLWLLGGLGFQEMMRLARDSFRQTGGLLRGRGWLLFGGVILLLLLVGQSHLRVLRQLTFDPTYFRADYRSLAAEIAAAADEKTAILLNAPNQWEVFTYYYDGPGTVIPFPRYVMAEEEQIRELDGIAAGHDRIYAIFWGSEGFDPARVSESWFERNGFRAIDEFRGDLRFVMVALPDGAELGALVEVNRPFGEGEIELEAFALQETALRPGDVLEVALVWKSVRPVDRRYKVFIHLLDENGGLAAQRDSEPAGNLRPTDGWEGGETIVDNHGLLLPIDTPPGSYRLVMGLYDIANPADRLPLASGEGDVLSLGEIMVELGRGGED